MLTTHYSQIKYPLKRRARQMVRRGLLDCLSLIGHEKMLQTPHIQFLYFHHVFEDEVAGLRKHLEFLGKHYEFISYSDAVAKVRSVNIDRPYVCFSSDDSFRNNLQSAAIFSDFGIKACYFICPSMVGETQESSIAKFCSERLHLPPISFLNWDDVAALQKQGHEIGNHTWSHVRLSGLSADRQSQEIESAHEAILSHCGVVQHFAYPYGLYTDINNDTLRILQKMEYESCASAVRGVHIGGVETRDNLMLRDQVIFSHPVRHLPYFIAKNLKQAQAQS